jgi:arabinogalactan oligomer/maltooligosaccharide transport system permease protein
MASKNRSNQMANTIIYVALSVMSVVWLIPIVWLVIRSFQAEKGAWITTVLPQGYTLNNYTRLFTETAQFNYPRWFINTFLVAVFTCLFATLLVLMISYTFSRLRFKSRKLYMNIGLILGMFPGFMTMIAVYHILKAIGLYQSHISLVLMYSTTASLSYFIAKGFFDTIPRALDEAATIDGATRNQIFWKITLPISKPIVIYTALTSFLAPWVDFIFASVIMKDNYDKYTLAVGLYRMLERENIYEYFTRFCAGAVLVSIPITILFIFFQKYYVSGVTGGATKG